MGMRYSKLFGALYAADGRIWLQAGSRVWDVADVRSVTQQFEGLRTASYELSFQDGGCASVRLGMPAAVVLHRLADPTYDEIDSWSDDIMKSLAYEAADRWRGSGGDMNSWIRQVLPGWERGFQHSS